MRRAHSDTASFRLAFAADPRADDIFLFTCQRLNAPKVDRSALQTHANGAARIARIVVAAERAGRSCRPADDRRRRVDGRCRRQVASRSMLRQCDRCRDDARSDRSRVRHRRSARTPSPRLVAHRLSASPIFGGRSAASNQPGRPCQPQRPSGRAAGGRAGRRLRIRGFEMSKPNIAVRVGKVTFANAAPLALIAGPCQLESRQHAFDMAGALKEIDRQARHRPRLQDQLRQGQPHLAVGQARRRPRRGAAGLRRSAQGARPAGAHRHPHRGAVRHRRRSRRHPADPRLPLPPDRPADRRRQDRQGGERQEGPVPGAVGHEERRRQDHRLGQSRTCWSPSAAPPSATTRWSPTCARCRSWPRSARR